MAWALPSVQPTPQGLYDAQQEHDACGVAFVATLTGIPSHTIVEQALTALRNLEHRGASGAEPDSGDGAGMLVQVPDAFLRAVVDFELPAPGAYAVGNVFLPLDAPDAAAARIEDLAAEEGLLVLGWRELPVAPELIGSTARAVMPVFRQLFVSSPGARMVGMALERRAFRLRKRAELSLGVYFASLSARTLLYKGMLTTGQLEPFFPDLSDERFASALALVHSRFSTNTFPSWPLAHPYRYIAHNGEINTVRGNRNWMRARESQLASDLIPGDLSDLYPICTPDISDSASFDEALELLHLGGPVAAARGPDDDPRGVGEPPDDGPGPPGVLPVPRDPHGAVGRPSLRHVHRRIPDRRCPRPQRSSPRAVLGHRRRPRGPGVGGRGPGPRPRDASCARGGSSPAGCSSSTPRRAASSRTTRSRPSWRPSTPTTTGCTPVSCTWRTCPSASTSCTRTRSVLRRQQTFGYTEEELRVLLTPMARTAAEPIGSMGTDSPIAVLSDRPRMLFDYFSQLFAQVTNPPLDAIREELVTSLGTLIGPEGNILAPGPGVVPTGRPAVPGHRQRRAGQDPARQRRRRPARASPASRCPASTRSPVGESRSRRGSRRSAPRSQRPSTGGRGSSS